MKKLSSAIFTEMDKANAENLTAEVKETLASDFAGNHHKPFTAIDLWNIHRQRKTMSQRRQFA